MNYIFASLLSILLLQASVFAEASSNVIFKDSFVFKVMGEIISIQDLQSDSQKLKILKCYYPNSLIVDAFEEFYIRASKIDFNKLLEQKPPFEKSQILFFKDALDYYKLKAYVRSQPGSIGKNIGKALFLIGSKNKCNQEIFGQNHSLRDDYQEVFAMEIFIRTRFIPDHTAINKSAQIEAAKANVDLFVDSVSKQIEDKPLW